MKRTLLVLLAVVTVAALPACSGGGGRDLVASPTSTPATEAPATTETLPACTDLAGTPVDQLQAQADQFVASCTGPTGQAEALAFAFYDCPDGRRLQWNDYGWGYTGGIWQAHARADGQLIPPDADTAACT